MLKNEYDWTDYYQEFADKLLDFKDNREVLIKKIFSSWDNISNLIPEFNLKKPIIEENKEDEDIDPFSVFALFNRGLKPENVKAILTSFKKEFSIEAEVPENFDGVPVMDTRGYLFYRFKNRGRGEKDIDNLWNIFEIALKFSDNKNENNRKAFVESFNNIINQKVINWTITMGLFWIRPFTYISLDGRNRWFFKRPKRFDEKISNEMWILDEKNKVPTAEEYLSLCDRITNIINENDFDFNNFPELSYTAYVKSKEDDLWEKNNPCWIYSSGENASKWDTFYENGVMGIGWSYLGDLNQYDREDKDTISEIITKEENYKVKDGKGTNQVLIFSKDVKVGDRVFVKDGYKKIVGYGIVDSDYYYDETLDSDYFHYHKVKWLKKGEWNLKHQHKKQIAIEELNGSMREEIMDLLNIDEKVIIMDNHLSRNKIYFGAPGTGKSYKLNQEKEKLFVDNEGTYERVTFHPDYTYANFVGTYKPVPIINDDGEEDISYKYVPGPFMRMLVEAFKYPKNNYLVLIEEINRANVAAVFGDVFQLLDRLTEKNEDRDIGDSEYDIHTSEDMRDYLKKELDIKEYKDNKLKIVDYEKLWIPKNLYLYATMNSADQGVFPMDTAFKRRWDFEYMDIDNNANTESGLKYSLGTGNHTVDVSWNDLRVAINHQLKTFANEDKLLGYYFIPKDLDENSFNEVFKNKVLMYLFEDVAKGRPNDLFDVSGDERVFLSDIQKDFDDNGKGIYVFCENITNEITGGKVETEE